MPDFYTFPDCNCSFEIAGPPVFPNTNIPSLRIDYREISLDCKSTWRLLGTGKTKMIFQLEKGAGIKWTPKLSPENMEHLAGLGAILRPGATKSFDENDISMTQHYCSRKNGDEPVPPYHPVVDEILSPTFGCLIFQEQSIKLAVAVAKFSEQEADALRKSIGKKLADEMSKMKRLFIEKAKIANIVSEAQAAEIFSWIEVSNRYSFNKSHAVEYGKVSYWCAWAKSHIAPQQYVSWLKNRDKARPYEETAELVEDAKSFGFNIYPPDFKQLKINPQTDGAKTIEFGIGSIKGIGAVQVNSIKETIQGLEKEFKPIRDWKWYEFLILGGTNLSKTVIEGLIHTGSMRKFCDSRSRMIAEYEAFREKGPNGGSLTKGEIQWIMERWKTWDNIADAIDGLAISKREKGNKSIAKKKVDDGKPNRDIERAVVLEDLARLIRNPITPYVDKIVEIASKEERYLGVALTCSIADAKAGSRWTMTCKDLLDNPGTNATIILKVKIEDISKYIPKKGKNVGRENAYLKVSDGTGSIGNLPCWADIWEGKRDEETGELVTEGLKDIFHVGRVLEIHLEKGFQKKGQKPNNNVSVKDAWLV